MEKQKNPDAKVVEIIGCAHCGSALIATEDKENYLMCASDFTEPHMFGPEAERLGIYMPQGDEHIVPLSYADTKITVISCTNCGETVLLCDEKKMGEDNFIPVKNFSYNNSIYSVADDRVFHVLDH